MKSEQSTKKSPKEVQIENKKPPVKVVEQKESTKSENSKTSKNAKKEVKEENNTQKIKTEEIEKEMLKGQDHIEEKEILKEKQEKKEIKSEPPQQIIKEEERKQTVVKPRETYLKEKMVKMNCNVNLLSNIQKEMGNKIKNIMTEEGVVVGEKTKDLKKYMNVKDKTRAEIEQYENKKKYKEIKNLMDELKSLQITLKQLEENEKMLMQDKQINLNKNIQENSNDKMIFNKSQNLTKIREVQVKKEEVKEKIADINYRIKNSIETEKLQTVPNKERVKDFISNFERDKEIIEIRAKKYFQEFKERNQRKQNDLNQIMEKRKKEIEIKLKEANDQNEEIRKKFKEKEKALEKEQTQKNQKIFLKYKPFINQKPDKAKEKYLYNIRYDEFIKGEEKYFQKKSRRK